MTHTTMKHLNALLFMAVGMLLASCAKGSGDPKVTAIPFKSSDNSDWGMVATDGKLIFEEEFKSQPTLAFNERFMVQNEDGLYEIYVQDEKPKKVGDEYVAICDFTDDVTPAVKRNERISIIDREGKEIAKLQKSNGKEITTCNAFFDGYAVFSTEDKSGIIDNTGKVVLEAKKYDMIKPAGNGKFLGITLKEKDSDAMEMQYEVIKANGEVINKLKTSKYDELELLSGDDELLAVKQTSGGKAKWGIIDFSGEVVLKPNSKIERIDSYLNGYFIYYNGDDYGVMDKNGEVKMRAKYDQLYWANDDGTLVWARVKSDGHSAYRLFNLDGEKVSKETYDLGVTSFDGKYCPVQIADGEWGFINTSGEEVDDLPDICDLSFSGAGLSVSSDYVDIDGIVNALNLTNDGCGGFGFDMAPVDLVRNHNANNPGDQQSTDPTEIHTDRLGYSKSIQGIDAEFSLYYSGYITEYIGYWSNNRSWTSSQPAFIQVELSGYKLEGKTKDFYNKLLNKLKTFGQVMQSNDNAAVIGLGGSKAVLVAIDSSQKVIVKYVSTGAGDLYIEEYSDGPTEYAACDSTAVDSAVCDYDYDYDYGDPADSVAPADYYDYD